MSWMCGEGCEPEQKEAFQLRTKLGVICMYSYNETYIHVRYLFSFLESKEVRTPRLATVLVELTEAKLS